MKAQQTGMEATRATGTERAQNTRGTRGTEEHDAVEQGEKNEKRLRKRDIILDTVQQYREATGTQVCY